MATAEKPVLSNYKTRMDKAVTALKEEFASLRTGRASATAMMRDSKIPIVVFSIRERGNFLKVLKGDGVYTTIA